MSTDGVAAPAAKTTILLVRHGETDWNKQARYQGCRSDIPLNGAGVQQVVALGKAMAAVHIDATYVSPAGRAKATAAHVLSGSGSGGQLREHADLRESDFGDWEGLTYGEIVATSPAAFAEWVASPATVAPPAGETLGAVAERVWAALRDIARAHPGEVVLVATHGGPIRAALATALGMPLEMSSRLNVSPGSLSVLLFFGDYCYVDLVNERAGAWSVTARS